MGGPRSLWVLAVVTTAFGAALWMGGAIAPLAASWAALTIVHALAMATSAALALLVTAAVALLAADWQADFQSHQAWAQVNIAAAELSLPVVLRLRAVTSMRATCRPSTTRHCGASLGHAGWRHRRACSTAQREHRPAPQRRPSLI